MMLCILLLIISHEFSQILDRGTDVDNKTISERLN